MIVDLETAKRNLHVVDDDDDENLMLLLETASEIVVDFLKLEPGTYDIDASPRIEPPKAVTIATLLVLENLYDRPTEDPLTDAVRSVLHRRRDPALA